MKNYFITLALTILLVACATPKKITTTDRDLNYIELRKNDEVELFFITNASLGAHWECTNCDEVAVVKSVSHRYERIGDSNTMGFGSQLFWNFKAMEKGVDTLQFLYGRFDGSADFLRSREVIIKVK